MNGIGPIFPDNPYNIAQVEEKEEGGEDIFGEEGKQLRESNSSSRHPDDLSIVPKEGLSTGMEEDDNDHGDNDDDDNFKQLNHLA